MKRPALSAKARQTKRLRAIKPLPATADVEQVVRTLRRCGSARHRKGMARFAIRTDDAFGVSVTTLRRLGRQLAKRHDLALGLWQSGFHEARILATIVADPEDMTEDLAERWAGDLDSWDLCDQFCSNLMRKTSFAWSKQSLWCVDDRLYVRRAGFSLLASLAVHDRTADNDRFARCLVDIERASSDERHFVKKAVSWALRQTGKRSIALHGPSLALARQLIASPVPARRWIGRNAARELERHSASA